MYLITNSLVPMPRKGVTTQTECEFRHSCPHGVSLVTWLQKAFNTQRDNIYNFLSVKENAFLWSFPSLHEIPVHCAFLQKRLMRNMSMGMYALGHEPLTRLCVC